MEEELKKNFITQELKNFGTLGLLGGWTRCSLARRDTGEGGGIRAFVSIFIFVVWVVIASAKEGVFLVALVS